MPPADRIGTACASTSQARHRCRVAATWRCTDTGACAAPLARRAATTRDLRHGRGDARFPRGTKQMMKWMLIGLLAVTSLAHAQAPGASDPQADAKMQQ